MEIVASTSLVRLKTKINQRGSAGTWVCEQLTGHGEVQPTLQQITELAVSVAAYDKWNKVLEAFRI